jgi:hypothetical protein
MDAAYLKATVGPALADALARVSVAHPDDPIDFIAQYLYKVNANAEDGKKVRENSAIIYVSVAHSRGAERSGAGSRPGGT